MKTWTNAFSEALQKGFPHRQQLGGDEQPLRAELFSAEQMELHGRQLAASHVLSPSNKDHLLQRLNDNQKKLDATRDLLSEAIRQHARMSPAAEWLLDNFHLIEEQIRTARQHLPRDYSRELPHLAQGPSAGLPRVYDLALAAIAHGDGHVDTETLSRFIAAYQSSTHLTLGELWAIPIMLRLALIENLRRVSVRLAVARAQVSLAREWADRMITIAASDAKSLILVIADMARSQQPMHSPFVAELTRKLQGLGPALALPLTWIEQRLAESSRTIEQLVLDETHQQALDQIAISNSIASLRLLGATDWRVFVESLSTVEMVLRQDPADAYPAMDFATRDRYRHVIGKLARLCKHTETDLARLALGLARAGVADPGAPRNHVGYYLIDRGLHELEQAARVRLPLVAILRRQLARIPLCLHTASIGLLSLLFGGSMLVLARQSGMHEALLVPFLLLTLLASSQLAAALVNWVTTMLSPTALLPRMDFDSGVPTACRTLVVVPCILSNTDTVSALLEALEVRFLGNRDPNLHFGLLTDHVDAAHESLPADAALVQQASAGIAQLNTKYREERADSSAHSSKDPFCLFHRHRHWNPVAGRWMGQERKRGKLADLNALLRGAAASSFALIVADLAILQSVRYVITLDADTELPRDSARQLVATMAHPLHHPGYDSERKVVIRGYGILQPRMSASLTGAQRSQHARLCGSEPGIDPYTRSTADVYQDLYQEGSFVGKGIYEVDAFEYTLANRFPNNLILSHDLLEGCYARSGLLSDVCLYEDYPARYETDVLRQRRWIRGDWQIARWLLPWVPLNSGTREHNPLSHLSRWKIFDNLRRSLVPIALLVVLLTGWSTGRYGWLWTLAIAGSVLLPILLNSLVSTLRKPGDVHLRQHLTAVLRAARDAAALALFRLACLPYEAWFSLDAIVRAIWRQCGSGASLLEWSVAGITPSAKVGAQYLASYRRMWIAPVAALTAAVLVTVAGVLLPALPLLLLWLLAPALACWLSQPLRTRSEVLSEEQTLFLRRIARRSWAYFERYVTAADHWLPPDNFQEEPGPLLARRTSPTNIGLALLANLAACEFGYISPTALARRTADTFRTLSLLERSLGHFYNWYDTSTLEPLPPRYISTVDSGNLAGHLLTLREGLLTLPHTPLAGQRPLQGIADTLAVFRQTLAQQYPVALPTPLLLPIEHLQALLDTALAQPAFTLPALGKALTALNATLVEIEAVSNFGENGTEESALWLQSLTTQCTTALRDLHWQAPWLLLRAPPAKDDKLVPAWLNTPTLQQVADYCAESEHENSSTPALSEWQQALVLGQTRAAIQVADCIALAQQAEAFATMEFAFLYDKARHLLAIGYNVDNFRLDTSFYDLLASEARFSTFVAIAQGKLPQQSWFALGRLLTSAGGDPVLVSWSGSMFEYLMPQLVMPTFEGTLLDQTCKAAVARQIAYGKQRGLPWGISESGYNNLDAGLNYQYHAFGVPGLGLKRGLGDDLVITPHASALALMVAPDAACQNMQRLAAAGLEGPCGFYEAVDYTPLRLARGQSCVIVRSFMAHHQGMSLLALLHALHQRPLQALFAAAPRFQATLLLLQERIPATSLFYPHAAAHSEEEFAPAATLLPALVAHGAMTASPEVQLLSNGRYHVTLTNSGGGYSRWNDVALTRWREDTTRDHWGSFIYLQDVDTQAFWSAAHQPTLKRATSYEAVFSEGRAEFRRRDHSIETYTEIVVSPEDDVELRRVRLTNHDNVRRTLELTSYAEVVLAPQASDEIQTAFGNLFVQSQILPERRALLCTRRARSDDEHPPGLFHLLGSNGSNVPDISYESDRMRFIGRGRTLVAPAAMDAPGPLSGSQGSVLDPIVAIRCRFVLEPRQSLILDLVTGVGRDSKDCKQLIAKYQDRHLANRVFDLAGSHAGAMLRQINANAADAWLYRQLAGRVLFADAALRADSSLLRQNRRGQSALWAYSISGDLPIVLLKISRAAHLGLARQLIQCHSYWRLKGLMVDLVIWNEDHIGYRQELHDQIMGLISSSGNAHANDRPGGIFVRTGEQVSQEDRILMQAVARVIINDQQGSLAEQARRRRMPERQVALLQPRVGARPPQSDEATGVPHDQGAANGIGGFSADGLEYVIVTDPHRQTPLPWVNVLANPGFGTVLAESGLAYTWSENAHEFRLTPWSDDAVGASGGEACYLRDEDSGHYWSPCPQPAGTDQPYVIRHGFGYSSFEHSTGGIHSQMLVYVDAARPVKFIVLKIRNDSARPRRLSACGYVEWVLGDLRSKTLLHVVTEIDAASGALFAHNPWNSEFPGRVAFFDVDDASRTLTGDRTEFIGRNGCLAAPAALSRINLSGRLGAGLDPCGAIQVPFELAPGATRELIFRLGVGVSLDSARELAQHLRRPGTARAALEHVKAFWQDTLGAVQIDTPDSGLNALANGWLLYQTLACRVWARSGFYQSGGAFGFRDQLQDTMALVHATPALARAHLLRCAARQYPEGDVQHWWHPPAGRGVRTRCSDDYLWLPLAVCRYVASTGDTGVLDEGQPFLAGRLLADGEESYYDLPQPTAEVASLYDHCKLALLHGLRFGEHGLPLMGSGDWNDGMNLVGIHGKGESVWLGFFLHRVLLDFAELAALRQDHELVARCRQEAQNLSNNLDLHGWDGQWYRRAWFDDGTPLGSAANSECRIDALAQSWAVLSGVGTPERQQQALAALDTHLVRREAGLVQLLDPPFDVAKPNPGYIKGYVPGVRENGGQYTHAAVWAAMAYAAAGNTDRAWELMTLINPLQHALTPEAVAIYKTEPYVVAADVYAVAPHTGRGGWSWYTGSAGWYYRLIVESLLGLRRQGTQLTLAPSLPAHWPGCTLHYRYGSTQYRISISRGKDTTGLTLDGVWQDARNIALVDDGVRHEVGVVLQLGPT